MARSVSLIALALFAGLSSLPSMAEPVRFAPNAISIEGRITLTPAITPDGQTAYFPQSQCANIGPCPQTLHVSYFKNGEWTRAAPVTLPKDGRVDWPSVTPDGKRLLFSWSAKREKYAPLDVDEDFDLYSLSLTTPDAEPQPLDIANINRPRAGAIKRLRYVHNETSPIMTANGDLYFWTERFDAIGERDIFYAPSDGKDSFETARPLPAPINSKQRDNHAWVSPEGGLMLLTYNERGGEGGEDVFVSRKIDGAWTTPENIGPGLNSSAQDFAARLTPDKSAIVWTSTRRDPAVKKQQTLQVWTMPVEEVIASGPLTREDLTR